MENKAKKRKIDLHNSQQHDATAERGSDDHLMDITDFVELPQIEFDAVQANDALPRKGRQCTCCVTCEELFNASERKINKYEKEIKQMKHELKKIRNKAHYFQNKCRLADTKLKKQNEMDEQLIEKIEVVRLIFF